MNKKQKNKIILDSRPKQESGRLQFSFKHFDDCHPKFGVGSCDTGFLRALLIQLKVYSEYTEDQFRDQNNRDHRHFCFWAETTEPHGFTHLSEEIQDEGFWQFALCPLGYMSSDDKWRVYGMLIDNMFYIVWLDPVHKLGPRSSRHAS